MSTASLDTNILLRWLLKDIESQAVAADKLLASNDTFDVADAAISELVYVLEKGAGMPRTQITENIMVVLGQANIRCNRALYKTLLPLYVKHPGVSFNDCYLAVHAERSRATPLYTFDKKLANQLKPAQLLEGGL